MAPISLIQERRILLASVIEVGKLHGVEMDIVVNFSTDNLILSAYCATGSYQGVLITRDELENGKHYAVINDRTNAAIKIVKPTFCEADEYDEVMQAQEIMDKLQP